LVQGGVGEGHQPGFTAWLVEQAPRHDGGVLAVRAAIHRILACDDAFHILLVNPPSIGIIKEKGVAGNLVLLRFHIEHLCPQLKGDTLAWRGMCRERGMLQLASRSTYEKRFSSIPVHLLGWCAKQGWDRVGEGDDLIVKVTVLFCWAALSPFLHGLAPL
jgi:hypothetical protein